MEKSNPVSVIFNKVVSALTIVSVLGVMFSPLTVQALASVTIVSINGVVNPAHCIAGELNIVINGQAGDQGGPYEAIVGDGHSSSTPKSVGNLKKNESFSNVLLNPYTPTQGGNVILVNLYHGSPTGNDSHITAVNQCVAAPTEGVVVVKKHVVNNNSGTLSASAFTLHLGGNNFAGSETGTDVLLTAGTYTLSEDSVAGYTGTISGNCGSGGSITVVPGENYSCTITNDDNAVVNNPPVITPTIGNKNVDEGTLLTFTALATDPESNPLTFSLTGSVPTGASITSAGVFTWTPNESQGPGVYPITISVTDGLGTDTETINVTVNEVNSSPVLSAIGNKSVNENSNLTFAISALDSDTPANTLTYSATNLPTGATFNAGTQTFSWTPDYTQAGTYNNVHFEVSDGSLTDSEDITITVGNINRAPTLASIPNQVDIELVAMSLTASATDPDSDPITYSLSGAPTGMTIDGVSGAISWTPTEAQGPGSYDFSVIATDGSLSDTKSVHVDVDEANIAPTTIGDSVSTHMNTDKVVTLSGSDVDVPAQTLTYVIVTPPSSGTLGSVSGNSVTYSPGSNYTGSDSFTFKVTDSMGADSNVSTVNISVNDSAPTLSSISDVVVNEGDTITVTPSATDPDSDPLTYSVTNAPAGSSFNTGTGVLSWTTSETDGPSTHTGIIITVTDGSLSDSQSFSITINEVNVPPVADPKSASTNEDTSVVVTLSGTDSDVPVQSLTYAIASPASSGTAVISGNQVTYSPNADFTGADSFTYTVSDGVTTSAPATVSITVDPINDAPTITLTGADPLSLVVGDTYTEQGATASDVEDGNLDGSVIITGTLSTSTVGIYVLTYTVTDSGALSASTTRTINVTALPDTTAPVITLIGNSTVNLTVGDTYTDDGATATDNVDGNITGNIATTTTVNTAVAGTYTVTYNVSDSSGNNATPVVRTVIVSNPVIVTPPPSGGGGGSNGGGGGGGGGGNGSPYTFGYVPPIQGAGSGGTTGGRIGEVLGASISPEQLAACLKDPYLKSYLKKGAKNDKIEVIKLQTFLNDMLGSNLPTTGYFGPLTFNEVKKFQSMFKEQVLTPWVKAGASSNDNPSGYVYKTTKRWINILKCKDLEAITPIPPLEKVD